MSNRSTHRSTHRSTYGLPIDNVMPNYNYSYNCNYLLVTFCLWLRAVSKSKDHHQSVTREDLLLINTMSGAKA
jgi:hypothetical protein